MIKIIHRAIGNGGIDEAEVVKTNRLADIAEVMNEMSGT
jgi:hypothetical protein